MPYVGEFTMKLPMAPFTRPTIGGLVKVNPTSVVR